MPFSTRLAQEPGIWSPDCPPVVAATPPAIHRAMLGSCFQCRARFRKPQNLLMFWKRVWKMPFLLSNAYHIPLILHVIAAIEVKSSVEDLSPEPHWSRSPAHQIVSPNDFQLHHHIPANPRIAGRGTQRRFGNLWSRKRLLGNLTTLTSPPTCPYVA